MKILIYLIAVILLINNIKSKEDMNTSILPDSTPFRVENQKLYEPCWKDVQCTDGHPTSTPLVCDKDTMECKSNSRCSKSEECLTGLICENSFCRSIAGCRSTDECVEGRECVKGKCLLSGAKCNSDRYCLMGQYCFKGQCRSLVPQPCEIDGNCSPGSFCYKSKCIRLRNRRCVADSHCKLGHKCIYDRCKKRCKFSSECSEGKYCDKVEEVCKVVSQFGCINSDQCPFGTKCMLGKCRAKSTSSKCKKTKDCKGTQKCIRGMCLGIVGDNCVSFLDCKKPFRCDDKKCYDPRKMENNGLVINLE